MDKVYLNFQKNSEVNDKNIKVSDVASVWCCDTAKLTRIKNISIVKVDKDESTRYVISALKVISIIEKSIGTTDIVLLGEPEFVVSYKPAKKAHKISEALKVFIVSVIVFCGSAFAIMAYETDIDINGVFKSMNEWVGNSVKNGVLYEQIAYAVGLMVGILIFYNRFGKRKSVKDPTPLDIQMRLYEDDINTSIINKSSREERTDDVV